MQCNWGISKVISLLVSHLNVHKFSITFTNSTLSEPKPELGKLSLESLVFQFVNPGAEKLRFLLGRIFPFPGSGS